MLPGLIVCCTSELFWLVQLSLFCCFNLIFCCLLLCGLGWVCGFVLCVCVRGLFNCLCRLHVLPACDGLVYCYLCLLVTCMFLIAVVLLLA